MKFTIVILICVLVLVEEMSAAPTKDKKKDKSKNDKSLKKKHSTEKKAKKQYIPAMPSTTYGSPCDSTYSTGYPSFNPCSTGVGASASQQQNEDIFNSPVKLVQIKDLKIKNGVIKQSDVVEG